jgi:Protein of unknown function (DUF2793)
MPQSPRLSLPLIAAGQGQKDVTHNEALLALDRMVALAVASRSQASPPPNPVPGEMHIVPAAGAVAWGHPAGTLVQWQGAGWLAVPPADGQVALVADEGQMLVKHGGWQALWPVAGLSIAGRAVLSAPPSAVPLPAGGATVDIEARAALAAVIVALQLQGILAP